MDAAAQQRMRKLEEVMRQVPVQYQNKQRLQVDLQQLFRVFHTLQPQTGSFSGGGRSATLFYLYGVLPITYMGSSYNIPVTIYFDPPYPRSAPRCFVTPTEGMAVSPSHPNVNPDGMFFAPSLSGWNERTSTLTELISIMISSFSAAPPVYAKPAGQPQEPQKDTASAALSAVGGAVGGAFSAAGSALGGMFRGSTVDPAPTSTPSPSPSYHTPSPAPAPGVAASPARSAGKDVLMQRTTVALKERWPVILGKIVSEHNDQLDKRNELRVQAERLQSDLAELKTRAQQQETQTQEMAATEFALTSFVQENQDKEPDLEDMKNQLDVNAKQVLECLSEELALEEFLTVLDELLATRKINIDDFMRETRDVSRRKFMCLMQRKKSEVAVRAGSGQS